jgi:hypothetical protein
MSSEPKLHSHIAIYSTTLESMLCSLSENQKTLYLKSKAEDPQHSSISMSFTPITCSQNPHARSSSSTMIKTMGSRAGSAVRRTSPSHKIWAGSLLIPGAATRAAGQGFGFPRRFRVSVAEESHGGSGCAEIRIPVAEWVSLFSCEFG